MTIGNSVAPSGHEQVVEPEDSTLWSRVRTGNADAFGLLFERHARTIYNYCFRRVGDWAAAEDLVSIVFLEACRPAVPSRRPTRLAVENRTREAENTDGVLGPQWVSALGRLRHWNCERDVGSSLGGVRCGCGAAVSMCNC